MADKQRCLSAIGIQASPTAPPQGVEGNNMCSAFNRLNNRNGLNRNRPLRIFKSNVLAKSPSDI